MQDLLLLQYTAAVNTRQETGDRMHDVIQRERIPSVPGIICQVLYYRLYYYVVQEKKRLLIVWLAKAQFSTLLL